MNKTLITTLGLALSCVLSTAQAATALNLIKNGANAASDENREYLVDRNWNGLAPGVVGSNAGQLDIGDSLRGILNINTVNSGSGNIGGTTTVDEFTGIYQALVVGKVALGGGFFNYLFAPDPAFEANICGGNAGCANAFTPGTGAIVAMFSDGAQNFAGDFDDPGPATPPAILDDGSASSRTVSPNVSFEDVSSGLTVTEEAFAVLAMDGVHFWTLGFSSGVDLINNVTGAAGPDGYTDPGVNEGFDTTTLPGLGDNLLNAFNFTTGTSGGILNGSFTRLAHNVGIADGVIINPVTPGLFGGPVEFAFTGNVRGVFDLDTPFEASSDLTISFNADIPEPATLALVGMGLLGLGFGGRRKKRA